MSVVFMSWPIVLETQDLIAKLFVRCAGRLVL